MAQTNDLADVDRSRAEAPHRRGHILILTIAMWSAAFVTVTTLSLSMDGWRPAMAALALRRVATMSSGAIICLVIDAAINRWNPRRLWLRATVMFTLCPVGGLIWTVINALIMSLPPNPFYRPGSNPVMELVPNAAWMTWVFIAWTGARLVFELNRRLLDRELQLANSRLFASRAQNEMLRYQLNPHFLFNTLSALATIISESRAQEAEKMVLALSSFLRASLVYRPEQHILLSEEISIERQYMSIEALRFEDRLDFRVEATPEAMHCLVPNLILQPLLENAIKYGVSRTLEPVRVSIVAELIDGKLRIAIRDDARTTVPPTQVHAAGVGLENVGRRIQSGYGQEANFRAGPAPGGGFEAVMVLPVRRAEAA